MKYAEEIKKEINNYYNLYKQYGFTKDEVIKFMELAMPYEMRNEFRKVAYL